MSIPTCPTCKRPYWNYSGSMPKGYCSVPCKDARPRKKTVEQPAETPSIVLLEMRDHLGRAHQTQNITAWFENCRKCDDLQERYAAALREVA